MEILRKFLVVALDVGDLQAQVRDPVVADRAPRIAGFRRGTRILEQFHAGIAGLEHDDARGRSAPAAAARTT